jgi:cadmium resistance protein CadD (predicted permease)
MTQQNIKVRVNTEARQYNTLPNLNRDIKFFGLTSIQVFVVLVLLAFVFMIQWIVGLLMIIPVYVGVLKVYQAEKKGNPSFIDSKMVFKSTPKKVFDKNRVLQYLKK